MANASGWKRAVLAPVFLGCLASAMMVPGSALVGDPAAAQSSPAVGSPPPARQAPALLPDDQFDRLDVTKFARPTLINNKFLPMKPGTRYIYDGTTVEDDGKGFPEKETGDGMGMHIMRYRASAIGAAFEAKRGERGGTVITCSWRGRVDRDRRYDDPHGDKAHG